MPLDWLMQTARSENISQHSVIRSAHAIGVTTCSMGADLFNSSSSVLKSQLQKTTFSSLRLIVNLNVSTCGVIVSRNGREVASHRCGLDVLVCYKKLSMQDTRGWFNYRFSWLLATHSLLEVS